MKMKKPVEFKVLSDPVDPNDLLFKKAHAKAAAAAAKFTQKTGIVLEPSKVMVIKMTPEYEAQFKKKMAADAALRGQAPREPHPTRVIKAILQDHLAPYLKAKGFRKKGRHFWRVQGDIVDVLDVQNSQFNDAWESRFLINLHVGWMSVQQVIGGVFAVEPLPPKNCMFRHRLTPDMEKIGTHWWHVGSETDATQVAKEVFEMLETKGVPWMESKRDLKRSHEEVAKRWPSRAKELKAVMAKLRAR